MTTDSGGAELVAYAAAPAEQYQPALAMTPEQAKALDEQVRQCTKAVLREGTDFGVIPGTGEDRKVLLKPGAEKLLQWFGFGFRLATAEIERDADGAKQGVTYRCTITKRIGHPEHGLLVDVATCEGYAGYDEAKFYQTAEEAQFKAEAKERMWAAKDKRPANPNKWKHLTGYRAPWNTIIKMAQKRAIVGATIDATAAAGLFGQDEDEGPVADDGSTWYEQALEQAITFTAIEAGQQLLIGASHAARDGLCTPGQATHVKNRVRQRLQLLQHATPVDVEDLGRQAAAAAQAAATADKPPLPGEEEITGPVPGDEARASQDAKAGSSGPGPAEGAPGDEQHRKLVGTVQGHMKRLKFAVDDSDRGERVRIMAVLAGYGSADGFDSASDFTADELAQIAGLLAKCRNRAALDTIARGAAEGVSDV